MARMSLADLRSTCEVLERVYRMVHRKYADQSERYNRLFDKTNLTIYIGDSVGDLLCLLEADVGVVIASSSSLGKISTHFGVSFVPLFSALIKKQKEHVEGSALGWKGLSGVLYTVSSWAEVHSFYNYTLH
ncbi:putative HAD superfamily protein [Helianthus anomalus]